MSSASDPASRPGYLLTLTWFPESGVGGVNQAIFNQARVMLAEGTFQPFLLITTEARIPAEHPQIPCPVESLYLKAPDLPQDRPLRSLFSFLLSLPSSLKRLNRFLLSRNIQIVACHFPETDSVQFGLLRWLNIYRGKFLLSFHGEDIKVLGRKNAFGRFWARWLMRHADLLIACSEGLRKDLVAFEPACAPKAAVIYNAIDIPAFRSRMDFTHPLPPALQGKRFLLNIARYEHKKGHDILITAFEAIASQFPDVMLVTIGGSVGAESAPVRAMVDRSPMRDRILMLENLEHAKVGAFFQAAELFVLASRREGFPFVLLEAGALQVPVAAANCIGVGEIIHDNVTGRLVPVEDPAALASAIAHLLSEPETSARLAQSLHSLVAQDFNWQTIFQRHLDLVNSPTTPDK